MTRDKYHIVIILMPSFNICVESNVAPVWVNRNKILYTECLFYYLEVKGCYKYLIKIKHAKLTSYVFSYVFACFL